MLHCSIASAAPLPPVFVDATGVAGLRHSYRGNTDFVVGGGAAAFDCSGDGLPDLLLTGAEAEATLWLNETRPGRPPVLSPLPLPPLDRATGVWPFDADDDGIVDLAVTRFGVSQLLTGDGACGFAASPLLPAPGWATAFAATWEAGATRPTLFLGLYVSRDRPLAKTGNCDPSLLLRPGPQGWEPTPLGPGACTLSALFLDWGAGRRDLRLANDREYFDRGQSDQIWRIDGPAPVELGRAEGWDRPVLWGMGLAAEDIDGDGLPETYVTNMADNRLERLHDPASRLARFDNISRALGVNSQRPGFGPDIRPSTAWHVEMQDFDNDGWIDIWVRKGNVEEMPGFARFDPDALLMGAPQGGFTDRAYPAGIASETRGRGGVAADIDGDGWLDLVTVNRNQPARLFMNLGGPGAWIAIDPRQPAPNRLAVDARVELRLGDRVLSRTRRVGGGHGSGSLMPLHFGLGPATEAEVRVVWPDGSATDWTRLAAGRTHIITRGTP